MAGHRNPFSSIGPVEGALLQASAQSLTESKILFARSAYSIGVPIYTLARLICPRDVS